LNISVVNGGLGGCLTANGEFLSIGPELLGEIDDGKKYSACDSSG
jgi:hypothetical protein